MVVRNGVLAAAMLALSVVGFSSPAPARKALASNTIPLTVMTARGVVKFRVEVARTEAQQEKGLMYRTKIPAGTGMLFPMNPPRMASFWMKNCPVPEDMIFVRADGTIARIAANTTPYSLSPVSSGEPVAAVFEIAGGEARRLGIAEGNKIVW